MILQLPRRWWQWSVRSPKLYVNPNRLWWQESSYHLFTILTSLKTQKPLTSQIGHLYRSGLLSKFGPTTKNRNLLCKNAEVTLSLTCFVKARPKWKIQQVNYVSMLPTSRLEETKMLISRHQGFRPWKKMMEECPVVGNWRSLRRLQRQLARESSCSQIS